ncbi:MAG: gluconate:H+ symporter [Bacteroidota bacterium]|nr:gluconate:H+ symporter [Bacteroidota bacterium]
MDIYFSLIIGIFLLLVQVIKFRFSPFIALLTSSIAIGLLSGLDGEIIINNIQEGMGSTLGYIAVIVGLGAMFGAILESTGGAKQITNYLLSKFGEKKSQWALLTSGFFIAIPVFFDVAFILLLPVIYSLQKKSNKSLVYYALPLLAGLAVTHAFIPPTPGPVAVSQILGADLGYVMLFGLIVGIPSAIFSGIIFTNFITSRIKFTSREVFEANIIETSKIPSIRSVLMIILLPLILIIFRSLVDTDILNISNEKLSDFIKFVGHPFSALIIANIIAWYFLGIKLGIDKKKLEKIISKSFAPAGAIILITGAGGVLKQVLIELDIGKLLAQNIFSSSELILVAAFICAVLIRVLQGSSTVAMITSASLVSPLLIDKVNDPVQLSLIVISIAAGASTFSHVNDSGFWLVNQYLGLYMKKTFLSWTLMTTVLSISGLIITLFLSVIFY